MTPKFPAGWPRIGNAKSFSTAARSRPISIMYCFFQAEDGRRGDLVTGVQTCALPICTCAHLIQSAAGVMIFAEPRFATAIMERSEERRVGKECRSRWSQYHSKKNEILNGRRADCARKQGQVFKAEPAAFKRPLHKIMPALALSFFKQKTAYEMIW